MFWLIEVFSHLPRPDFKDLPESCESTEYCVSWLCPVFDGADSAKIVQLIQQLLEDY